MLKLCFDKRVIGGLAVVGLGLFVVAPDLFARAFPLLLVLACPLSMLFMGRAMMKRDQRAPQGEEVAPLGVAAPSDLIEAQVTGVRPTGEASHDGRTPRTDSPRCRSGGTARARPSSRQPAMGRLSAVSRQPSAVSRQPSAIARPIADS